MPASRRPDRRTPRASIGGRGQRLLDIDIGFALLLLFWVLLVATGGSSRADMIGAAVPRLAALVLVGGLWLSYRRVRAERLGVPVGMCVAIIVVQLAQLVPLPPALWTELPGRGIYLEAANVAGIPQPWRPLNLTPDRGWNAVWSMLPPIAILYAFARQGPTGRGRLVDLILATAVLSAVVSVAQFGTGAQGGLNWYDRLGGGQATGLFANRNHNALLLAMGLLIAVARAARSGWAGLPLSGALVVLFVLVIVLTGSRTGLLIIAPAMLFGLALSWQDLKRRLLELRPRSRLAALSGAVVALAGLAVLAGTFANAQSVQRLITIDLDSDIRINSLATVLDLARLYSPWGSGFGSFDQVFRTYEPFETLSREYLNQAHNDLLQIGIEAGLVGWALLVGVTLWWMVVGVQAWRTDRSDPRREPAVIGCGLLLLTLIASASDYPARTPIIMVVVTIAICWLSDLSALSRGGEGEGEGRATLP